MSADANKQSDETTIQIQLDDEVAKGQYANLSIGAFNQDEFILDFGFIQPHVSKANISTRVILNPKQAKRLCGMLTHNITQYEKKFGEISDKNTPPGIKISAN